MNKIAKSFFVSLSLLLVIVAVISAFLPKQFSVSRSIDIQTPQFRVESLLTCFSLWNTWSPWFTSEPTAQYRIDGLDRQVGSSISWSGKIVGKGKITLADVTQDQIKLNLETLAPNHLSSLIVIDLRTEQEGTKVKWTNQGYLSYPTGRLFGPFMDNMIGNDIDRGLINLKKTAEKTSSLPKN